MLLAAALLSFAAQPPERAHMTNDRVPTEEAIADVEKRIVMPAGAAPLSAYDRIYTEADIDGKDTILGEMLPRAEDVQMAKSEHKPPPAPIRRVRLKEMVPAFDGGCAIILLKYDVSSNAPPRLVCNPPGPG